MRSHESMHARPTISRHDVGVLVRFVVSTWTFVLVAACNSQPKPAVVNETAPAAAVPQDGTPPATDADAAKPAVPELTEEDKRLLAADPQSLTPEERRKRAFALRRKIMQNPDSAAARTLEDLRRATESGQLDPNGGGMRFEARTADGKPTPPAPGTMGPAGARPAEPAPSGAP